MNILTITTLFPNSNEPKHGIFIATRLRYLMARQSDIRATVIAPVPWFPFSHSVFGEYARYAGVPYHEVINGVDVYHPKYLVIPKLGMYLTPKLLERAIDRAVKRLVGEQQFDVIDGHYFFPDGVAIASVAEKYDIPFTCTARGTDINLIPQQPRARRMIKKVFGKASHLMAVCQALSDEMISIGAPKEKVTTLRNGVDLTLFTASDNVQQLELRKALGFDGRLIVSVGWLIERKGHHLIIEALVNLPEVTLAIIGSGPDEAKLKRLAAEFGVEERVRFIGTQTQQQINQWFKAADAAILASSREGWANVLLEAMASGTPVVATKVWGTPEVVASEDVGVLVERSAKDIADGVRHIFSKKVNRTVVRKYAEKFNWDSTSDGQYSIFREITKK